MNDLDSLYSDSSHLLSQCKKFSSGFKFNRKPGCIHFCRCEVYHSKTCLLDLEKFLPTSASVTLHIKCAYLQAYLLQHCADIKLKDFGHLCNNNEQVIRQIANHSFNTKIISKVLQLFEQCTKVCGCWKMSIMCCKYRKYGA